jgi:RHS repeat-associated protein
MQTAVKTQTLKRHRSLRWRRNVTQTRNYDQDYAVQSIGGLNYTVDTQGNIKTITDAAGGNGFDYDNLDRLTKVKNSATLANVTTLTYDKTGNRLSKTVGALASATYSYPTTNHRLTSVTGVARTFDANGNTTQSAAAKFFTYDARNRLVDFRTGTTAATIVSQYQFNAKGERVRKYKGTTDQSRYLYNEGGQLLIQNKVVSGVTTTQEMIWLDDMPIGVSQNGVLNGILTDHLNTPRQIFSTATQQTQWRWNAVDDAFGESLAVNSGMEFDLRFSGQFYDAESGMAYNYYRDCYEASTGRYCESDPIGLSGGMSTYGYVGGNPTRYRDPFGLDDATGNYVRNNGYGGDRGSLGGAILHDLVSTVRSLVYKIPSPRGPDVAQLSVAYGAFSVDLTLTNGGGLYLSETASTGLKNPLNLLKRAKGGFSASLNAGFVVADENNCPIKPGTASEELINRIVNGESFVVSGYDFLGGGVAHNSSGTIMFGGFGEGASFGYSRATQIHRFIQSPRR